jgi:sphingolipid delta-4 desaturase
LPDVRKLAPEFYNSLKPAASWFGLWLTFICNPSYSLYSRVLRSEPGS